MFLFFLFSCKNETKINFDKSCKKDWKEIKNDGVLTVLAENSPISFFIYKGKNMGFEYELLYEFAKDHDIRLNVKMVHNLDSVLNKLNQCEGDIIACNLTQTRERKDYLSFTTPHTITHQVLIQKKPEGWEKMSKKELSDTLINDIEELRGKKIFVWKNSTYFTHITKLNLLLKLNLNIIPIEGDIITEDLIKMVNDGKIEYTIVDENVAKINAKYYENIDYSVKVSDDQQIGFAMRKSSKKLLKKLNEWLIAKQNQSTIGEVKRKYFERTNIINKANQNYSSILKEGQLSPYDDIIKELSLKYGWDWRLISAIIYQESKFETWKISWAGAFGLFQFMPGTAKQYGISPSSPPEKHLEAGFKKLTKNFNQWLEEIGDTTEAIHFTLANFNSGRGHIDDARALAEKYGYNKNIWHGHVNEMILNLSQPKYYKDKLVRNGYTRGVETYNYVTKVMERFDEYKHAFPD